MKKEQSTRVVRLDMKSILTNDIWMSDMSSINTIDASNNVDDENIPQEEYKGSANKHCRIKDDESDMES